MSTAIVSPALSEGIPYSERTRMVAEAHPHLIEAMEKASQEFHQQEGAWQEEVARHQRNAGLPERSLQSPFGKALNEAAAAVVEKFEELLAAGAVTWPPVPPDNPVHDGKERM